MDEIPLGKTRKKTYSAMDPCIWGDWFQNLEEKKSEDAQVPSIKWCNI
jgi:hypothetical protein